MTRHFIRLLAGHGWVKRAWATLYEPRWVSAVYRALYLIYLVFGTLSIINPSMTISDAAGTSLTTTITR